jgi:hypothetical protein
MATPERIEQTEAALGIALDAAGPIPVITEGGIVPFVVDGES